ncbi:MAG: ABC transporter permease [Tepidisphaeraceae bacterium]
MKKELGIGALLLIVCATVAFMNPRFISPTNLRNQGQLIGMYGIFSIGLGIIIITGGIDLSVGSMFALEGVALSILLVERHWPWPLAVLAVIAGVVMLGVWHAFLITKIRIQPFIVTLCGLLIYRGLARDLANDETKGFGSNNFGLLRTLASGSVGKVFSPLAGSFIGNVPTPFVLLLIVALIMWVALHHSVYGRYLYAVGRNEEAARYSGINTKLVIGSAYALSMFLAAISGILFAFYTNSISPSSHGSFYELFGIAAAVVGGCSLRGGEGSILGIILGTVLLQVLQNIVNLEGIKSSRTYEFLGGVILAAAILDEIFGARLAQRPAAVRDAPSASVPGGAPPVESK